MQKDVFIDDAELGRIFLRAHSNAKRFIFRCTQEGFVCTVPMRFRQRDLLRAIEELRPRLKGMMERAIANQRQCLAPEDVEHLRRQAKLILPQRLQVLAEARGLQYQKVSIHKSRTRWGSCSSKGNISLSLFLMLVPSHLQDYVMQHELTHLMEMNHSPRFWKLLDEATGGKAVQYRKEIRNFHLPAF